MGDALCPFCQSGLEASEPATTCDACAAVYHVECWRENGGCAVYGCRQAPAVVARTAAEIPASYWGAETKTCPACGREIRAAALRCRHCAATFATAAPEDDAAFDHRTDVEQRLPRVRRNVVLWFVLSVIPCLAPLGALGGIANYRLSRDEIRALPGLYGALAKLGIGVSLAMTAALGLATLLYSLLQAQ